jgi:hypothetical protein
MCSLAICKPGIRSTAKKGDWVAGLGSKHAHAGDLSGHLVYAMHVDEVLSLAQYDQRARTDWPHRIPNAGSADLSCGPDGMTGRRSASEQNSPTLSPSVVRL